MQLTSEQSDIINSTGDLKINAVAGSGKTTTVIEYAKTQPANSRILYLAFNKTVKLEAQEKFREKGLKNVTVHTAHSLAYRQIIVGSQYKLINGYKAHELTKILGITANGDEKHMEYVVANHVNKFASYFCNSNQKRVQNLDYRKVVHDAKAKSFVSTFYDYIEGKTRQFLAKMHEGSIDITHDFYLKQYQLSEPQLPYDYILFDEGQDASPAMLDVFMRQKATKVIVGDTHQQIYSWRYAINSLQKLDFQLLHLGTSFRFPQEIADLAKAVLDWKSILQSHESPPIQGKGSSDELRVKATLARTNLGLLLNAIETMAEGKFRKIHFEGNISSYTYADDGASLYDVLNLDQKKKHRVKDELIQKMKDMEELEDYIEKTEDLQLGMMVKIVQQYGADIPGHIKSLKDSHVDKEEAEMIFSTVHKSKGMEYDSVTLVNDFTSEERLEKIKKEEKPEDINFTKVNEEINLLYVAITRTRNQLNIPSDLLPEGFEGSSRIQVLDPPEDEEDTGDNPATEKAYTVEAVRKEHKAAYAPWTGELDEELTVMFCNKTPIKEMAAHFGRTRGAIMSRIKRLELRELYG